jgi:hypothetical protein
MEYGIVEEWGGWGTRPKGEENCIFSPVVVKEKPAKFWR